MIASDTHDRLAAIFRVESPRLIAGLARRVRDLGTAEELAQDAFVAAMQQWPTSGVPDNPGAWLMATARHKALDTLRRQRRAQDLLAEFGADLAARAGAPDLDLALDQTIADDLLRLVFTTCHPLLSPEARVALTLRLLGGLSTVEIARAFLVSEATIAQRIVRAKRQLVDQQVPIEVPRREELATRLASVLEVIYLVFNEGYSATAGDDWLRPELCQDALRLARLLAELMPSEPEVHGLIALLELQASRLPARTDADGAPILLLAQNRARWDGVLIRRGRSALERAEQLTRVPGPYVLQAQIAACHANAATAPATDWVRIAALYTVLVHRLQSPVVELNRGIAIGMAFGPAAGLAIVDALVAPGMLADYHLLPSVRGDLLQKLGRLDEARREFTRAANLTRNLRERQLLLDRATAAKQARHGSAARSTTGATQRQVDATSTPLGVVSLLQRQHTVKAQP